MNRLTAILGPAALAVLIAGEMNCDGKPLIQDSGGPLDASRRVEADFVPTQPDQVDWTRLFIGIRDARTGCARVFKEGEGIQSGTSSSGRLVSPIGNRHCEVASGRVAFSTPDRDLKLTLNLSEQVATATQKELRIGDIVQQTPNSLTLTTVGLDASGRCVVNGDDASAEQCGRFIEATRLAIGEVRRAAAKR